MPFSPDNPEEIAPGTLLEHRHIFRLDLCRGPAVDGGVGRNVETLANGGNGFLVTGIPADYEPFSGSFGRIRFQKLLMLSFPQSGHIFVPRIFPSAHRHQD